MAQHPFRLSFERLPDTLPIFPLANAIAMPGSQLPLNIFEQRYLNMVFDALSSSRMIGMIQPQSVEAEESSNDRLFSVGTAGRVTSFTETEDGRLLIVLTGVCRFDLGEVIATTRGYRLAKVAWSRWAGDYVIDGERLSFGSRLAVLLRNYLVQKQIDIDWRALEQLPLAMAVNILISQLPFEAVERQRLVEACSLEERTNGLLELVEWKLMEGTEQSDRPH
jgi:uncharacterized protein